MAKPLRESINEIRARLDAATPGPFMGRTERVLNEIYWTIYRGRTNKDGYRDNTALMYIKDRANAFMHLKAPTDLDHALKVIDVLAEALECVQARHHICAERGHKAELTFGLMAVVDDALEQASVIMGGE